MKSTPGGIAQAAQNASHMRRLLERLQNIEQQVRAGGGAISLRVDAQGKTFGAALLRMEIDVYEQEL